MYKPIVEAKREFLLGKSFLEINSADSALFHLSRALNLFGRDSVNAFVQIAKARNYLGRTYRRKGQLDKAVLQYLAAVGWKGALPGI